MEKTELSKEEFEEHTKGKEPFVTISYYAVEGKQAAVANVYIKGNFLGPIDEAIFKQAVIQLGTTLAKLREEFLKEKERKKGGSE